MTKAHSEEVAWSVVDVRSVQVKLGTDRDSVILLPAGFLNE